MSTRRKPPPPHQMLRLLFRGDLILLFDSLAAGKYDNLVWATGSIADEIYYGLMELSEFDDELRHAVEEAGEDLDNLFETLRRIEFGLTLRDVSLLVATMLSAPVIIIVTSHLLGELQTLVLYVITIAWLAVIALAAATIARTAGERRKWAEEELRVKLKSMDEGKFEGWARRISQALINLCARYGGRVAEEVGLLNLSLEYENVEFVTEIRGEKYYRIKSLK
ncbi:MAG: hypothetical protein ACTSXJ_10780 [Candidatus Baldrarchaeia archaeon]